MLIQLLQGAVLVALTVAIHASFLGWLGWRLRGYAPPRSSAREALLLSAVAIWCVIAHLVEIMVWAGFYAWRDVMPDIETAGYFSAVTYATIGYGDVTPPQAWRLIAGMEGLTGILMSGWSAAFFFGTVSGFETHRSAAEAPNQARRTPSPPAR